MVATVYLHPEQTITAKLVLFYSALMHSFSSSDIKNEVIVKKDKGTESFFKFLSKIPSNPNDELHPDDKYSRLNLLLKANDLVREKYPLPMPGYRAGSNKDYVLTSDNYEEV